MDLQPILRILEEQACDVFVSVEVFTFMLRPEPTISRSLVFLRNRQAGRRGRADAPGLQHDPVA